VSGAENEAERTENRLERSGVVSGVKKNQVERERSGSGRSSERERSGERPKSAAHNLLHHKTTQSKKLKIDFISYHKTVSVNSLLLCCVGNKSDYLAKEHHFNYAALCPEYS